MEFDKSRVYTAVNADELKIGSRCIFADTMHDLFVLFYKDNSSDFIKELSHINSDSHINRFNSKNANYILAYLIEPPKEPQYKPFSSIEKAKKIIDKHGGWVNYKCYSFLVTAYDTQLPEHSIYLNNRWYSFQELYDFFIFADDGTPCGELAEE